MSLLVRWIISAIAVWVAVRFVPGIRIEEGLGPLFAVALVLGGVNAVVRPILKFFACSIIFLTLGLFLLVINAAMLLLAAEISQFLGIDFAVDGFLPALLGSIVISLVSYAAAVLLPERRQER
ncbi:MAG: phage holin family protein [Gemmatimonadota bacterium]